MTFKWLGIYKNIRAFWFILNHYFYKETHMWEFKIIYILSYNVYIILNLH